MKFAFKLGICLLLSCGISSHSLAAKTWREIQSENFLVYTDRPEKSAIATIHNLERFRAMTRKLLGINNDQDKAQIKLFLFSRKKEFNDFRGSRNIAAYLDANNEYGPYALVGPNPRGMVNPNSYLYFSYVMIAHSDFTALRLYYINKLNLMILCLENPLNFRKYSLSSLSLLHIGTKY